MSAKLHLKKEKKLKLLSCFLFYAVFLCSGLAAEPVRIMLAGTHDVSLSNPEGTAISLSYSDTVAIRLEGDMRFVRGIQLDLTAPQNYLSHRGSLGTIFYAELDRVPPPGSADVEARQLAFEMLPDRLLNTWQIPLRPNHGLRSSPYVTIPTPLVPPSSFPMLFRLIPAGKGISEEIERMKFSLLVKPIIGDEGALRIRYVYPENLPVRPVMALIDDVLIENPETERIIRSGEHHLTVLSEHYRTVNRSFNVEPTKNLEITVELQDPTPLLIFEYPDNARVFVNNEPVANPALPLPVAPGYYEVRFQSNDFSVLRPVTVQWGKTYKIALSVDVGITESD